MSLPTVSVVLPTKNAGDRFSELLDRVRTQTYDVEVELIVVDSGSEDGTVELARDHGADVYPIPPEEFHHGLTRNYGAKQASGAAVVFLVQDALPKSETWLESLVEPLVTDDASLTYARQVAYPEEKPMDEFFYSYFYPDSRVSITAADIQDEGAFYLSHIYISNVSSAVRADVWRDIQFRADIEVSEDKDFALRAIRKGHTAIYEPESVVYHSHFYNLRSLCRRRFFDGVGFATVTSTQDNSFLSRGIDYFTAEMWYLLTEASPLWIPYAILYDAAYYLSFTGGKIYGSLTHSKS